ncbi:MAG: sigma-54 dependent transcriptional regulator [Polyangiaceae bacterium]|nr:sigma-54 dependent transcriptional regulator [Polyangiaceae bacterium]
MSRALVIEDDPDVAAALTRTLARLGCEAETSACMTLANGALAREAFDVVLLDLGLPDRDGLAALDSVLERDPKCRVVVVTGQNDASMAMRALRRGALDYVVKPWERDELARVVGRALGEARRQPPVEAPRPRLPRAPLPAVGSSPAWRRAVDDLRAAAESSRAAVLICGESGTGKEVAAQLVHQWGPRAAAPFVTLNAACLPSSLLESELFGHEPGAFTGARTMRRGLFELASGGTLFLDEIGELPLDLQPKLLRVLEGHPFRRLGGEREVKVDVRLVAATNRPLPEMVRQGKFREDLYYRLRVLELHLPALRERPGDVRELALFFADRLAREQGLPGPLLQPGVLERLSAHGWPGNVRELRNVIERALVLSRGAPVGPEHLPESLGSTAASDAPASSRPEAERAPAAALVGDDLSLEGAVRRHVVAVYAQNGGNISRTAVALGISRVALRRKLRECGAYEEPLLGGVRTPGARPRG